MLSLNFFKHLLAREINVTVLMATEACFLSFPLLCLLISENESLIYNKLRGGGERGGGEDDGWMASPTQWMLV